jgi:hypothetical protein
MIAFVVVVANMSNAAARERAVDRNGGRPPVEERASHRDHRIRRIAEAKRRDLT